MEMLATGLLILVGGILMIAPLLVVITFFWVAMHSVERADKSSIVRGLSGMGYTYYMEGSTPIKAIQFTKNNKEELLGWRCRGGGVWFVEATNGGLIIGTPRGNYLVNVGDYIAEGAQGEIYPVKRDIFEESYDRVTN